LPKGWSDLMCGFLKGVDIQAYMYGGSFHGNLSILCMHKILVHAQESCACTRIFCMHKIERFPWKVYVGPRHDQKWPPIRQTGIIAKI
jgi:hypothetical protein